MNERNDENLPFVSFIIPTYNEEKNIERCLRSIKSQNYPTNKVEVIVVDGMSEDNTVNIAKNYSNRIILNKKRIVGNALKLGVEAAKGEILAIVNADSEMPQKDWLRMMVAPFSDPNVCGTLTSFRVSKTYPPISRCYHLMGGDPIINFTYDLENINSLVITKENYFPTSAPLYRRKLVLKEGNFKPFLPRLEDVDMTYRLVRDDYKLVFVPNTYIRHLFADSFSSYVKKTFRRISMFIEYQNFCEFKFMPESPNSKLNFLKNILSHMIIIGLLIPVAKGIRKHRDLCWFYYPAIVLATVIIQCVILVSNVQGRKMLREFLGGKQIR